MKKLRSDSIWNQLSTEQWETLEGWLFDENISYREATERVIKQWAIECSPSSVVRFYKHCAKNRAVNDLPDAIETAREIKAIGAKPEQFRESTLTVIRKRFFEQAIEATSLDELKALARIVNQSEEREIHRQRAALARERWQFKASQAAIKAAPELNAFAQEEEKREEDRIERIKRALFGKEVDLIVE